MSVWRRWRLCMDRELCLRRKTSLCETRQPRWRQCVCLSVLLCVWQRVVCVFDNAVYVCFTVCFISLSQCLLCVVSQCVSCMFYSVFHRCFISMFHDAFDVCLTVCFTVYFVCVWQCLLCVFDRVFLCVAQCVCCVFHNAFYACFTVCILCVLHVDANMAVVFHIQTPTWLSCST